MNTDKLNADFMDLQAIALKNARGTIEQMDIVLLTRQFKDHLDEVEGALTEKDELRHG